MFYGDGMITPAISVLGAVEGLEIITPQLHPFIVPVTLVIIVVLFAIQKHGTAAVGSLFGPVMCAWFGVLAILGVAQLQQTRRCSRRSVPPTPSPSSPRTRCSRSWRSARSCWRSPDRGAVRRHGHFGAKPIRRAWVFFVGPALVLNYFGRARCCWPTRRRSRIRSTCSRRNGR